MSEVNYYEEFHEDLSEMLPAAFAEKWGPCGTRWQRAHPDRIFLALALLAVVEKRVERAGLTSSEYREILCLANARLREKEESK